MSSTMFPHPRRIVTGHSPQGAAIVVGDDVIPCLPTAIKCNFAVLYETHQFPASNDEWVDPAQSRTTDLSNKTGTVLRVVDFPANTETIFHRTESLDYGILHSGEITCHLDDGVRVDMKAGDVCIQRGTIHGWTNYSDKPARMYFILSGTRSQARLASWAEANPNITAAHPVTIGEKVLGATGYSKNAVSSGGNAD